MKSKFAQFIESMVAKYGCNWQEQLTTEEYNNGMMIINEIN